MAELTPAEALSLYERNWRHVDPASLEPSERALIWSLAKQIGGGQIQSQPRLGLHGLYIMPKPKEP